MFVLPNSVLLNENVYRVESLMTSFSITYLKVKLRLEKKGIPEMGFLISYYKVCVCLFVFVKATVI